MKLSLNLQGYSLEVSTLIKKMILIAQVSHKNNLPIQLNGKNKIHSCQAIPSKIKKLFCSLWSQLAIDPEEIRGSSRRNRVSQCKKYRMLKIFSKEWEEIWTQTKNIFQQKKNRKYQLFMCYLHRCSVLVKHDLFIIIFNNN